MFLISGSSIKSIGINRTMSASPLITSYNPEVTPQSYILSLMEDQDEEEDIRLHTAAACGDEHGLNELLQDKEIVQKWINYRITPYLAPPLRVAVTGGNPECIRILLKYGAMIDLEDIKGQTPLFLACSLHNAEAMEVLLEGGAEPDGSKKNRCCPLLIAVRDGFAEGVRLLLRYGVNPEPFQQLTNTCVPGWPLHHSIVYKHFSSFQALLQGGAKSSLLDLPFQVPASTRAKLSVPHCIAKYAGEHPEFVHLFHECGGDLQQVNSTGETAACSGTPPCAALETIQLLAGNPLRLKSICRNRIRQILGRTHLHQIQDLDIPAILCPFLNFQEYDKYSKKTEENTHIKIISPNNQLDETS